MKSMFQDLPADADIIMHLHRGNDRALAQIFRQSHAGLFYFAMQIIKDQQVVEDMIAEAFIKLWERRLDFDNISTVKSFLYIAVRNSCINELRQSSRSHVIHQEVRYLTESTDHFLEEQRVIRAEILQKIWEDIEQLPPVRRKIFKMIYLDGLNSLEVAAALNISVDTVRVQKARALQSLRWAFKKND